MPSDPATEPRYRPQPALYPFTSRWCHVAGHRLHYLDEGPVDTGPTQARVHGPVLLFVHGNPSWSFLYRDLIRQLRGRWRCVAPDLAGLGLSATPPRPLRPAEHAAVVAEFLDALGLDDLVLVGHDWGGPIGLAAVLRRPAAVRGMVLANSFAWPLQGSWRMQVFSRLAGSWAAALASRCCNAFLAVGLRLAIRRRPIEPAVLDGYFGPFRARTRRGVMQRLARELLASRGFLAALERDLGALAQQPALLCWGGRDPFIGAAERRHFERLFPHHDRLVLPAAGHFVPEDAPQAMAGAIASAVALW